MRCAAVEVHVSAEWLHEETALFLPRCDCEPSHRFIPNAINTSDVDLPAPPISERTAIFCGLLFTFFYVAPFYISPTLRTSSLHSRDSPTVIKARVRAVLISCLASTIVTISVLTTLGHASPRDILRLFAIWPTSPWDCVQILLLLSILFIGPLFEILIVDAGWEDISWERIKTTFWTSSTSHRNVVVAPWCEELVFRSLVIALHLLADVPPSKIVFTSPLIFGVAHVHHFLEIAKTRTPPGQRFPPLNACLLGAAISLFQFTYTSLFGFFAAFVFLRTGNVFAAVTAHTFCNFMGFPRVWGRVGAVDLVAFTPDVAPGKPPPQMQSYHEVHAFGLGWTVLYYTLLIVGAYGFYGLLWPLTESGNALVEF